MISLERLKSLLEYNPETGVFITKVSTERRAKGSAIPRRGGSRYRQISLDGKQYYLHRLALFYMTGRWPGHTDHIDGDRQNNRYENLRDVTRSENAHNRPLCRRNTSGCQGVYWCKDRNRWGASIPNGNGNGSRKLGRFAKLEDAIEARKRAEKEYGMFHENHGRKNKSLRPLAQSKGLE